MSADVDMTPAHMNGVNGDHSNGAGHLSKRAQKRQKKKEKKELLRTVAATSAALLEDLAAQKAAAADDAKSAEVAPTSDAPEVQYVAAKIEDPELAAHFANVFQNFAKPEELVRKKEKPVDTEGQSGTEFDIADQMAAQKQSILRGAEVEDEDGVVRDEIAPSAITESVAGTDSKEENGAVAAGLSNKKKKKLTRFTVAELKQMVARPDVVEMHDANAPDPKLLILLKGYRNTVSVPRHWIAKSKYLQRKRGVEKLPFKLPQFIEDTGIGKLRGLQAAAQDGKSAKQKSREKMQPKMGKLDIDYQVLHDAFFVYQTRPKMTKHGELYYESKEFEAKLVDRKVGDLSEGLMTALGMTHGKLSPPPWLFPMQRYGPPPSYQHLKFPGVNAPIPHGARWGTRDGEWGRPPLAADGTPLWGGTLQADVVEEKVEVFDKTLWGKLDEEEPESEAEEEEAAPAEAAGEAAEEEEEEEAGPAKKQKDAKAGIESTTSTVGGMETPAGIQLRKRMDGTGTETPDTVANAARRAGTYYQVLEEKESHVDQNTLFGSTHTYVVPAAGAAPAAQPPPPPVLGAEKKAAAPRRPGEQVEVALEPEELEALNAESLKRKFEQQVEAEKAAKAAMRVDDDDDDNPDRKKRKTGKDDKKKYKF